jgi:hypothetical protein
MPSFQAWGAFAFGFVIGWYVYYINRYRRGDVQLSDLVTLIGVLGGPAVLALFPQGTDLFGAYGIGLALGFFSYFAVLIVLVLSSKGVFKAGYFLDGRRLKPYDNEFIPSDLNIPSRPMEADPVREVNIGG